MTQSGDADHTEASTAHDLAMAREAEVLLRSERTDPRAMAKAIRLLEDSLAFPHDVSGFPLTPSEPLVVAGANDGLGSGLTVAQRCTQLNNLSLAYRWLGQLEPVPRWRDAAVATARLLIRQAAADGPGRVRVAEVHLAEDLRIRWEAEHREEDLREAIGLCQTTGGLDDAFEPSPRPDTQIPEAVTSAAWGTLCTLLRLRYEHERDELSLIHSIRLGRAAVAASEPGSPAWRARQNNLSIALHDRWLLQRALSDLDEAIYTAEAAIGADTAPTAADVPRWSNLGSALRGRFIHRLGLNAFHPVDPTDLRKVNHPSHAPRADIDRAVDAFTRAAVLAAEGRRDVYRCRLAAALITRYDAYRDPPDLRRALLIAESVDTGQHAPPLNLNDVAYTLARAGADYRRLDLVEMAVVLGERALAALAGGANAAMALENLGLYHQARHFVSAASEPDESAFQGIWRDAAFTPGSAPWYRVSAAKRWAETSFRNLPADRSAIHAYAVALDLVAALVSLGIDRPSREAQLRQLSTLALDAAAASLVVSDPQSALLNLERSRAVLWNQSTSSRQLATAVTAALPELAHHVHRIQMLMADSSDLYTDAADE